MFFVSLILIPESAFEYANIPRMDGHSSFSKGVKNKQTTNSKLQTFGLSLNMSNSKRFFVCLILSLLLPKSTSAQIVDQRDDMNWTFFMAVTWTVEPIKDLNFILGIHFD